MIRPPVVRAVVSDLHGDVMYDSAEPPRWRPGPVRPPIVRRYAPPPAPVSDPGGRALSALLAGLCIALAAGGALVAVALIWGAT